MFDSVDDVCSEAYESHDWQWVRARYRCARCGLVDLDGSRLLRRVIDAIRGKR